MRKRIVVAAEYEVCSTWAVEPLIVAIVVGLLLSIYVGAVIAKKRADARGTNAGATLKPLQRQAVAIAPVLPHISVEEPTKASRKRRTPRVVDIAVETPLGRVTFRKPRRPARAIVVALGQSEEHLEWFFDVYRREYLERAATKVRKGDTSSWSADYAKFAREASTHLANLSTERKQALRENQEKIARREPTLLGAYDTIEQAREAARWLAKKKEPTRNAGWLEVHVVEIPTETV